MLGFPLPESCVGLFITLCTEWILEHIKTNMLAHQYTQLRNGAARLPFGSTQKKT